MTTTTMTDVRAASERLEEANAEVRRRRSALAKVTEEADRANGPGLVNLLRAKDAAQRELTQGETALNRAADDFQAAQRKHEETEAARRTKLAPGVLSQTRRIAKDVDAHFAALERLFDEGEALATSVDRDFVTLASHSGAVLYAKELGGAPVVGTLRVGRTNKLRAVFARWREGAARLG